MARPGSPGIRPHQPVRLRPHAGPSELGASGKLAEWDRTADLHSIEVPTLVIGAQHDTMDPAHMEWMARAFPRGTYLHCPAGSHMAMYDDQRTYVDGLVDFLTSDKSQQSNEARSLA